MAKIYTVIRKAINQNIGLIFLIFLLSFYYCFETFLAYSQWKQTDFDFTVTLVVLFFSMGSALTALAEAFFDRRY